MREGKEGKRERGRERVREGEGERGRGWEREREREGEGERGGRDKQMLNEKAAKCRKGNFRRGFTLSQVQKLSNVLTPLGSPLRKSWWLCYFLSKHTPWKNLAITLYRNS
jgi:hypothetical protein